MLDVEAEPVVDAHILVCHPYEREEGDHITPPILEQHPESRKYKDQRRYVMAKAVFTSKKVKKLAPKKTFCPGALALAILSRLAKYLFMGNGPRDASNRNTQHQKPRKLHA